MIYFGDWRFTNVDSQDGISTNVNSRALIEQGGIGNKLRDNRGENCSSHLSRCGSAKTTSHLSLNSSDHSLLRVDNDG